MRQRRHRHKESFSLLLISNTGQNARHFHVRASFLRLLTVFVLCVCVSFGWLAYHYLASGDTAASRVNASEITRESELIDQIAEQEKQIGQLEKERDDLDRQNKELVSENKALLAAAKTTKDSGRDSGGGEPAENDPAFPSRYPYSETGEVVGKFSESYPYVSINTREKGNVVAAGAGTVTAVGSGDNYPLIIEIEHGNGYVTRYMFPQETEASVEVGEQVETGAALAAVGNDNIRLDYQVIRDGEPIDPLIVFEAKG